MRITLHADSFAWSLSSASISRCALAADRQSAHVPYATIAFNTLQSLKVHADFPSQITFDEVFPFLDGVDDLGKLLLI